MRFNKKRLIAIVVFLLLSFFMITFGNPVENTAIVTRNVKFIDSYNDKLLADKKVELGKAVTAPTVPKHKDLVFINWYIKGTDTVANLNKILTNSTFVTKYAADKNNNGIADDVDKYYTVKFIDGLDNSLLKTEKVLVGLDATAPLIPAHEGYTFGNWDLTFENVKKNITVTAIFNINSYNLKINYNYAKDNSEASPSYNGVYAYNSNYSVISPLIAGYTGNQLNINGTIPASDQTLEVLYYANKDTAYKVEHYKENLDGTYTLVQTDDMAGETDTLTSAIAQEYEGYTVLAFNQENINGNGSTLVKIYYNRNSYELTYKVDGEVYTSATLKYGETIVPEVNPTRVGYTFSGWSTIPSVMPANDVEINGSFEVNKYFLKIYYQNEYGLPILIPYIALVNYGEEYNVVSDTIAGYSVDKPTVSGTMTASHKLIFVTYVANRNTPYTIEYYKNNVLFETEYKTGTTDTLAYIIPDNNKYSGYYYDVLNYRNDLADFIDGDGSTVLKVYYKASIYRITYNANKPTGIVGVSSTPSSKTYTVEDEFNITATMSSTSHNFMGWYSNSSGTGSAITKIEEGTTGNKTLYAKWDIKKYTVTFNEGDHGTINSSSTPNVPYNSTFGSINKPLVTPNAGYTFSRWSIAANTRITSDRTATALYTANTNTAYKVEHYTENLNGGYTLVETENKTGTTDTLTTAVAKSLTGFTVQSFSQENINGNGSTVVKIYYSRDSYTLTYKPENGSDDITSTEKYGASISAPTVSKTGYTFNVWTPSVPSTMPASDVTYTALWDINSYKLTINYKYSDGSVASTKYEQTYNYNLGYSVTSPLIAGYKADTLVVSGTIPASDVIVDVTYTANTDTAYKVEHYIENLDGSYNLIDTEDLTGTTNMTTNAVAKSLTGFTVQSFSQKTIAGNGSTVVEIYYTRNVYNLVYKVNGVEVSSTNVKYQTPITPLSNPELSGYTFSGWSSIPSIMPAANVEVNGSFTINSYKLTINYKYSDGSIAATKYEQSYNYNLGYNIISSVKAGYTVDKTVVSGTMPANDVVVDVIYTANTNTAYKVEHYTENLNGGYTLVETENKTGTTDTQTSAVAKPLTGFTVQSFSQENINGNGSTVVKIYYSRDSYTLTYKPENGSDDITSTEKYGALISAPLVSKTGYTFNGWTPSVPSTMPALNSTYTASWNINSYTLTFVDTNDEEIIREVNWGDALTDIPTITPITGYTCVWDRTDFTNITANDTVEAVCSVINYTVTYNLNTTADIIGASHSNALNIYNINTALYTIANATSTSDDFDGWFTTADNSGTKVTTLAGGTIGNIDLYAHWSKKAYTVDFEENGGTQVLPLANVYYGSKVTPQTTTRVGFAFDDWYKEETFANKWLFDTDTVTRDLTLYANWTAEKYDLEFDINDFGVVNPINPSNPDEYTIADNITFNNASSKSHTFLGWFTALDNTGAKVTGITAGTITGDQTYYAHWEIKSFDLTVNTNGGVWSGTTPQTLDYGESLTIANPTKDGYVFSGWTLTGNDSALIGNTFTMGSENATLTANWTVRTDLEYTIYYKLEGTTTDIQSSNTINNKTFGQTYTETAPIIAGYEKLDTTKDVLVTTGTNEIIFYYRAIANITASVTSTSSSGSSVVSYGDTITYTLTGINTGTGAGVLTAKDLVLMAELSGLDIELIDTGLTSTEIADRNALLSNSGLIKTINAGDTYTLVFRVRVLGNAGSSISNKLTYNVGSDPELTDTLKNYNIEKTMSLRAISEIGVNVVLTLDISGSMEGSKFSSMKSAATTFIDTIFPSGVDNEGTEICVVTFSKPWWDLFGNNAMLRGCTGGSGAKTPAQLKSIINGLETGSSTPYTSALSVVSDTLDSMENRNTDNDNIVVFLSDGEPTDGNGYIATANALKASGTVIYSIGFEVTGSAETTLRSLATSSSYYYTGTVSNIESVFSNIASEISTESKRSVNGVVEISNVNTTKVIEFKVNGSTSGYPTTVANALSQSYLINNGTTYSIDLTKFSASSSIEFTYYQN